MTENKASKAAIRARMAETGEPYSQAARRLDEQSATIGALTGTVFDAALEKFGIPKGVLTLALRHCDETDEYPVLGPAAADCLKIYLDLKDWVALAKARLGRPEFPHDRLAYETLCAATAAGQVIVPLSPTTYMELARISSLRQRTDLADVIAEISGFVALSGRSIAVDHQMRTALAARFGGEVPAPIRPFGLGSSFALGDRRRLVLRGRDGAAPGLPDALVHEIETSGRVMGEYMMLRGPAPEEIPDLRALGYRPEAVAQVEEDRVNREKELAAMLQAGTADRGRLGDIVHARHLYWELGHHLPSGLKQYGIDITDFFANGKEWLTAFLDDIPSAAINITLAERGFRNSYKAWTGNDLRDADAMSAAIPYCNIVLTDKYVAAQLARSQTVAKQGTLVLARLRDLNDKLPDLITLAQRERRELASHVQRVNVGRRLGPISLMCVMWVGWAGATGLLVAASGLQVLGPAGGDVFGRVGVQLQVPVVGVAEATLQFCAVVPGGGREPVGEGVPGIVRAQRAELALGSVDLQVMDASHLAHDRVDRAGRQPAARPAGGDRDSGQKHRGRLGVRITSAFVLQVVGQRQAGIQAQEHRPLSPALAAYPDQPGLAHPAQFGRGVGLHLVKVEADEFGAA